MATIIIDASNTVLGRVCSKAAKIALLGDQVVVINAEKAVVSGDRDMILGKELAKLEIRNLGNPQKGPFHEKRPDKYVRRAIRGMLPWHRYRGREAFAKVQVYIDVPESEIKKNHKVDIKTAKIEKLANKKKGAYITVADLCRSIGGKF
jgi:large subunit ribosomal protein L13